MTVTTGWGILLVAWAFLISTAAGTPPLLEPPPATLPALDPVAVIRQRGVQRRMETERILAWQEADLERMRQESKLEDVAIAKSTTLYHYTSYRFCAIELNRVANEYIRRATGFRLSNAAERLPVLK